MTGKFFKKHLENAPMKQYLDDCRHGAAGLKAWKAVCMYVYIPAEKVCYMPKLHHASGALSSTINSSSGSKLYKYKET